ncbi:hypothetical protein FJY94_05415 [Candidatus Kaiserbacteria bacterium]|nr:hypothetical protein [Candidatus Kaiserbacteria bacterium]
MRTDDPRPVIESMLASGMAHGVVRARMLLDGWTEEVVDPIFAALAPHVGNRAATLESTYQRHRRAKAAGILVASLVAAAAVGAVGGFTARTPATYAIEIPAASSTEAALSYGALPALADPAYYAQVKHTLTDAHASFISANLTDMQLTVYKDGEAALTVPILAKGKVGSWWETPVGIYKIETRERDHYSSFGHVHQPYSMAFQGNFFIHGWPVYDDGTPVSSSYSGGCIRLATEDAGKVYELVRIGMPVIVYKEARQSEPFTYQLKTPAVSAAQYLVIDMDTATVLASKGEREQAPIASITKLVTALVATEYINLDKELTVPAEAAVYTSVPRLRPGTDVRAYDLLFLLLQESSNEAAEALASVTGREAFVSRMNAKARAIGLSDTVFSDPSGAHDDISTPADIFTLLRYIDENRRFVFNITAGTLTETAYGDAAFGDMANFNLVETAPARFLGGKIGQTNEAGETYAGIFSVPVGGRERRVAVIVLGSSGVAHDVEQLVRFVGAAYAPAGH